MDMDIDIDINHTEMLHDCRTRFGPQELRAWPRREGALASGR